jgi:hypothetical protein
VRAPLIEERHIECRQSSVSGHLEDSQESPDIWTSFCHSVSSICSAKQNHPSTHGVTFPHNSISRKSREYTMTMTQLTDRLSSSCRWRSNNQVSAFDDIAAGHNH